MTQTPTRISTLAQINICLATGPTYAERWDRDTIEELEAQGYIMVRASDGELCTTGAGQATLRQNAYPRPQRSKAQTLTAAEWTLTQIYAGLSTGPIYASRWTRDTINELEALGYITIREYDGAIGMTNAGEIALPQSAYPRAQRSTTRIGNYCYPNDYSDLALHQMAWTIAKTMFGRTRNLALINYNCAL